MSAEPTLLGSVINAVKMNVSNFEVIFRQFPRMEELQDIDDERRYPLSLYVEMTDYMEQTYGYGAMLKLGKAVGKAVIDVSLSKMDIHSISDAIAAIQGAHEYFCQPTIGAFTITRDDPGVIEVEYTAPYNCKLQEGLLTIVAKTYGSEMPIVTHQKCRRDGDPCCVYLVSQV